MFGVLDVLVLGGVATAAVYWFFLRKKEDQVNIKEFKVT